MQVNARRHAQHGHDYSQELHDPTLPRVDARKWDFGASNSVELIFENGLQQDAVRLSSKSLWKEQELPVDSQDGH